MIVISSDLSYLIPQLRLRIGDLDGSRYVDDWLNVALISAFNALQGWWDYKYKVNITYSGSTIQDYKVSRYKTSLFQTEEPPVIEPSDEHATVLYASILVLGGYLEQNAWNLGSWRDNEISVSNIEGGRALREKLRSLWEELTSIYKPPSRKLARAKRTHLQGYIGNIYEHGDPTDWNK